MDINELEAFKMSDAVKFHNKLNPNLWTGTELDPVVREQLLLIAEDFVTTLGIKDLDIVDITISGSNAAYSYTPHSDLDLHVLVDMSKLRDDEIYRELFTAKKTLYNDSHNITVHGVPVELYVQDVNEPVKSLGEYSVLNDKWIRIPKKTKANFDQAATKAKFDNLAEIVELALKTKNLGRVEKTIDTIKRYRKAGLSKGGEFGPENLAFKALRKQGGIQDLYDLRDVLRSEKLSIEEYANEDYDPNGPPPGPEFKPTMPAGTIKVDVSDVYDWYKLGQHISNMKGLGKHDFGKGPPSTILSFGDEDTEHKYIQDLEKTGLSTTDIDPVDPKQPKGMKRQKTDPAYNVNEASGYIPSEKEKNDPRFLMALTKDVRPDANKKNAKAFGWKVSRAGIPPQARADGKIAESLMNKWKAFLMEGSAPKIGYHVTATEKLPIILKHGIKADRRGNSYVWDSLEMAQWFKDFQNDEDQDRTIVKVDMSDLDAQPDPETDDMSEWSSRFDPGTKGGAWIVSGPIPSDKIIG